jgi:hypothetical protein
MVLSAVHRSGRFWLWLSGREASKITVSKSEQKFLVRNSASAASSEYRLSYPGRQYQTGKRDRQVVNFGWRTQNPIRVIRAIRG